MYKRKIIFLTPLIFFITMMIFFCPLNVRAEVSMSDIPEDAQSITLVWPDGSSETFNDHKAALGAADKEKLLETRTTDKDGTIILKDYIRSGN